MLRPSSVRSRIGTRISSRKRCGPVISTPARASSSAGSNSAAHGSLPCCACASARPGDEPGHGDRRARRRGTPASTRRRSRSAPRPWRPAAVRDGEEAVEQRRLPAGVAEEEEAAARRARQRPFRDERGEGGGDDGVDGIPSARESPRTRLGGVTVPGCDGSAHARSVETARRAAADPASEPYAAHGGSGRTASRPRRTAEDVRILHGSPALRSPATSQFTWPLRFSAPSRAPTSRRPVGPRPGGHASQATAAKCRGTGCGPDAESPDETARGNGRALPGASGRALPQPLAVRRPGQRGRRRPRCRRSRAPLGRRARLRRHEHLRRSGLARRARGERLAAAGRRRVGPLRGRVRRQRDRARPRRLGPARGALRPRHERRAAGPSAAPLQRSASRGSSGSGR